MKTYCKTFPPVLPATGQTDITVIQNTYMQKTLNGFCTVDGDTLTYTLTK